VAVFAGQDGGSARPADRVGDQAMAEEHSIAGQAIEIRSGVEAGAVGADGPGGMIVGEDEEDIRSGVPLGGENRSRDDEGQGNSKRQTHPSANHDRILRHPALEKVGLGGGFGPSGKTAGQYEQASSSPPTAEHVIDFRVHDLELMEEVVGLEFMDEFAK